MNHTQYEQGEEDDEQQHQELFGCGGRQHLPGNQTIRHEQQRGRQHAEVGVPVAFVIGVIPIHRADPILQQFETSRHIIGVSALGQLAGYVKV